MIALRVLLGRSALLAGARVVSKLATLAVVLSVARTLALDEFGLLGTLIAFSTLAGLFSDVGLLMPSMRSMSLAPDQQAAIMSRTLWPRVCSAAASGLVLLVGGSLLGYPPLALGLFLVAAISETFFVALVRAHEVRQSMGAVTAFIVVERVSYALWVLGALSVSPTLEAVAGASLVSMATMLTGAAWYFRRCCGWTPLPFHRQIVLDGLKEGWPFLFATLLSTVYYRLDIVILEQLASSSEAGVYNASMRVTDALMFIPMSAMATVYPMLAASYGRDPGVFQATLRRATMILGVAGMVVAVAVTAAAGPLIDVLYPDRFSRSVDVLRILGPMLLFYFLNHLGTQSLIAMNRERLLTAILGAVAFLAVVLNILIVPRFGAIAIASVRLVMEMAMAAVFAGSIWHLAASERAGRWSRRS